MVSPPLTAEEILDLSREPEPRVCPFCGSELHARALTALDAPICWCPVFKCDCEGWGAQQTAYDAQLLREEEDEKYRMWVDRARDVIAPPILRAQFSRCSFDSFVADNAVLREAKGAAMDYVASFAEHRKNGVGLYIVSRCNGTGKTHLALAVAKALREKHNVKRRFVKTSNEILADIKHTFGDGKQNSQRMVSDFYRSAELVVIDDMGKEQVTEWALAMFFDVINARYIQKRPTIVTSNYMPEELVRRLALKGDDSTASAIVSRLVERSITIALDGAQDYRYGEPA